MPYLRADILGLTNPALPENGTIPACAGNTNGTTGSVTAARDHPSVRGERADTGPGGYLDRDHPCVRGEHTRSPALLSEVVSSTFEIWTFRAPLGCAHGRAATVAHRHKKTPIGFDYVHAAIDDHSRLAYAGILPDESGATSAAFLLRAAAFFAAHGIRRIERVITGNALAYRRPAAFAAAVRALGARQMFLKPHCPWQNGKAERFNRTLQAERAYRRVFAGNDECVQALRPWLEYYNTQRRHSALDGLPPISRLSPTS